MSVREKRPRALITGGSGFIGSHLCEELLRRGFHVTALDDFSTSSPGNVRHLKKEKYFRLVRGSILSRPLMRKLIRTSDHIFHLAAAVGVKYVTEHPLHSMIVNLRGTETVLEFAATYRKKILLASSSEVYGKPSPLPIREESNRILGPTTVSRWSYAEAKATDECLALAYGQEKKLPVVIVRFFNISGPRQSGEYGMVIPRFIGSALAGRPLIVYGNGSQIRSFMHVKDASRAIADLSEMPEAYGKVFNVGAPESCSIKELAARVKRKIRARSRILFYPYEKAYGKNFEDITSRVPDITRLKKLTGFSPHYNLDGILDDMIHDFLIKRREKSRRRA